MPDWLHPFTEGLIEDSLATELAGGDFAREEDITRPNESNPASMRNVCAHFPKDPNFKTCRMTRASRVR